MVVGVLSGNSGVRLKVSAGNRYEETNERENNMVHLLLVRKQATWLSK